MEVPGYKYIDITEGYMGGAPRIKGTRISVSIILEDVAHGSTIETILEYYPSLTLEAVLEAIQYASEIRT